MLVVILREKKQQWQRKCGDSTETWGTSTSNKLSTLYLSFPMSNDSQSWQSPSIQASPPQVSPFGINIGL